ncbi:MAG: hypothetical protein K0R69_2655 [Clostridia bacterium]|jgi:hypothetical protein|nr:hypothetical protein [Clostridia bacterium]
MMDTVATRIQGDINYIGACGARYTEEWGTINPEAEVMVFSCFSRELLLDDNFSDEIQCIDEKHARTVEGTLSFGEFSNRNEEREIRHYAGVCIITSV